MAIQIGKYKRPGIFQEEFDGSVISSPTVDGITNTIIGVSRKGPVNTPILLKSIGDLERVFGPLDRQLERKGSFFHRTISKMLESSPVYAINLLLTDDALDTIEYQSVSCATTYQNDIERLAPYRRFFDTTGFWKKDTDSFISVTKDNEGYNNRLLNFTNLSDKYATVFVFKSKKTGFNRSLLEWYGGVEKLPPYVYATDLASDYLVDVVIIAGDYSNYQSLSVDSRFSTYFSPTGLRKDQVRNFANDRNVTTLAYLEGLSLIPYFRDLSGQNIFIETVLNRSTDQHGIFCAFNSDLFETDYPKGLVDLIGNNFVGDDLISNPPTNDETNYGSLDSNDGVKDGEVGINFLSYKETITESISFNQVVLDRPGNVVALFGTQSIPSTINGGQHSLNPGTTIQGGVTEGYVTGYDRTYWFSEGYVNDIYRSTSLVTSTSSITVTYKSDPTSNNGYAIIGGNFISVLGTFSLTLDPVNYSTSLSSTQSYYAAFVLDTTGTIKTVETSVVSTKPLVSSTDIVLGYASFSAYGGSFVTSSATIIDLTVDNSTGGGDSSYKPLVYGVDWTYSTASVATNSFRVEFLDTNQSITPRDYERYRRIKQFNYLLGYVNSTSSSKGAILLDPVNDNSKLSLSFISVTEVRDVNTQNRSFVLKSSVPTPVDLSNNIIVVDSYVDNYFITDADVQSIVTTKAPLVFYKLDDEFILGNSGVSTTSDKAGATMGVAAKYSKMYQNYEDGIVSTSDVIYQKTNYSPIQVQFIPGESFTASLSGYDYLVFRVDQTEVDYLENLRSDIIDLNNGLFNAVEPTVLGAGYQFLLSGVSNIGSFKIKSDEGLLPANSGLSVAPSSPGDATTSGRAWQLTQLSASNYDFVTSATYSYFAFEVEENVIEETLPVTNLFAYSSDYDDAPIYLDMHMDSELNLHVTFEDKSLQSSLPFGSVDSSTPGVALWSNNSFYVKSFDSNYRQSLEIEEPVNYVTSLNKVLVRASRYTEVKIGDYLEASYATASLESDQMPKKLTRILSKKLWSGDQTLVEITCDSEIKVSDFGSGDKQTFRYTSIDDYVSTYKAISLKGFRIRQDSLPDGTESKQSSILDLVAKGTPIFKSLVNKESFNFRYLIDSFGLGLTERSKQQLVDICGGRLDCFGILNMPSLKSFKNSSSPSFVNAEGVLQVEFIGVGGDPESNPAFLYSFGDGVGVSTVGYFTPYVTVNDNGRPVDVPPAAYVASTYMRKHNSTLTNIVPWTIAAGVTNGRITNIAGVEHDFTPEDIEFLNQAQMNPIVFKRNRGYSIETENTAQTLYKSSLSYIHSREVLVELEREISRMLLDFQWKFNTPEVRAEIKLRADVICEKYVSRNGLYNYFNKIDEENNNQEIIDNQMGVIDTYVEIIKGMGIIINNINILPTGSIQSGGFIGSN